MNGFEFQNSRGKVAERKVADKLRNRGWKITDVSGNRSYQEKDVDLIASKEDILTTIEIKADYRIWRTDNICVELITNLELEHLGWINYCEADYMFYCDMKNEIAYIFTCSDLKEFIQLHSDRVIRKELYDKMDNKTVMLGLFQKDIFLNYLTDNRKYLQILELL